MRSCLLQGTLLGAPLTATFIFFRSNSTDRYPGESRHRSSILLRISFRPFALRSLVHKSQMMHIVISILSLVADPLPVHQS